MVEPSILLIHPPVAKPSEPPAGIARLAGALRTHGVACSVIDANIEGLHHLLGNLPEPEDTWSRRAQKHLDHHLQALGFLKTYAAADTYGRAVSDINRLLAIAGRACSVRLGLANYSDDHLSPLRTEDLLQAAGRPERNVYFGYFHDRVLAAIGERRPSVIGLSIGYLSQALCAFALMGLIRREFPGSQIVIGGGLVTSWLKRPRQMVRFKGLVDEMVAGPGEAALLKLAGKRTGTRFFLPDYDGLMVNGYLSPGPVLPFSASDGCWWRRCAFCPERAEKRPFAPLPRSLAVEQLQTLTRGIRPSLIHLLDNALSPALLKSLAFDPPGAPWYGFVRIGTPLDDPGFCRDLAASGCVMLKIGLESGDQRVLDALDKGIRLDAASKVLDNLKRAGIATYVYLLFGTPAEDEAAALRTLEYAAAHHDQIDFLNLAIFNLPLGGPEARQLKLHDFYPGDLALYSDFTHPTGWNRGTVRRFIEKKVRKHPAVQPIIRRDPPIFTSNHAPFFCLQRDEV